MPLLNCSELEAIGRIFCGKSSQIPMLCCSPSFFPFVSWEKTKSGQKTNYSMISCWSSTEREKCDFVSRNNDGSLWDKSSNSVPPETHLGCSAFHFSFGSSGKKRLERIGHVLYFVLFLIVNIDCTHSNFTFVAFVLALRIMALIGISYMNFVLPSAAPWLDRAWRDEFSDEFPPMV